VGFLQVAEQVHFSVAIDIVCYRFVGCSEVAVAMCFEILTAKETVGQH
jgi:2-oxoglutarate dehydrogenase complex dehydrogenase (E1) component-like enzyme